MTPSLSTTRVDSALPLTADEVERIRSDFPILRTPGLVYLDSGATAQRPTAVLDAERAFLEHRNAAVHRGAHRLAAEATEEFEAARETVAGFVGVAADEVAWALNATDALNTIAFAIGNASAGRGGPEADRFRLAPGDEIVTTEMEHHANLVPWQELAARTGARLRVIPLTDEGTLDLAAAAALIGERTRVVAFTHVSNVLGTVNPVEDLVRLAREVGAVTVLDACQSAPHRAVDIRALGVDFAAFSAHKMLGPTGLGVLVGRRALLNALPPARTGGSMITTVTLEASEYLPSPQRFEAGTQPVSQAVAFAEAIRYLDRVGLGRIHATERILADRLAAGVAEIPGVRLLGPAAGQERAGLVSVDVEGVHAHDVGQYLDDLGIAVRVGHHCAQPLHRRFGVTASTRASVYLYSTETEVDAFLNALADVRAFFGAVR